MERMKKFRDKWSKMTTEEKVAFIDKREKAFSEMFGEDGKPNPAGIVKHIDAHAEEWLGKSVEEKEACVRERMERHAAHHNHKGFSGGHGHGDFFGQRGGFPGGFTSGECDGREGFGVFDAFGFGPGDDKNRPE